MPTTSSYARRWQTTAKQGTTTHGIPPSQLRKADHSRPEGDSRQRKAGRPERRTSPQDSALPRISRPEDQGFRPARLRHHHRIRLALRHIGRRRRALAATAQPGHVAFLRHRRAGSFRDRAADAAAQDTLALLRLFGRADGDRRAPHRFLQQRHTPRRLPAGLSWSLRRPRTARAPQPAAARAGRSRT